MRLMTGVAEHPGRVFGSDHLGEALGLGRVLFVAAAAEIGDVRKLRYVRGRVVGMLRLRTVTGLTSHLGVFAESPSLGLVVMAGHTGLLAGKRYGPKTDRVECGCAVMAELAEGLGDDRAAHHKEDPQGQDKNRRRLKQMGPISKQAEQRSSLSVSGGG